MSGRAVWRESCDSYWKPPRKRKSPWLTYQLGASKALAVSNVSNWVVLNIMGPFWFEIISAPHS